MQQRNGSCSKCGDEPRASGHRWCLLCKAAYQRKKRAIHGWRYGQSDPLARLKQRNRARDHRRRQRHPPGSEHCMACDRTDGIEHHHPDHIRHPDWTYPLCVKCHRALHRRSRENAKIS